MSMVLGFIYLTAVPFISWTLKAFGNFTDCKNKLSSHVALHNSVHWFLSRLCPYVQPRSPKTFGKVEAVAEIKKHRYSWTESGRFLESFHTLCLVPSQHHLHLPHTCVDRQNWGLLLSICSTSPTPNPLGLKSWTSHSRLLSWHQSPTSPSPSKFLAIIFLEECLLCPLVVRLHLKTESRMSTNFSCNETIRKTNKVRMLQR